jgi:hypothetical protein
MNDFDRHVEFQLRLLLDPIVKASAPPRKGSRKRMEEARVLELPAVMPLAVAVPVEVFA